MVPFVLGKWLVTRATPEAHFMRSGEWNLSKVKMYEDFLTFIWVLSIIVQLLKKASSFVYWEKASWDSRQHACWSHCQMQVRWYSMRGERYQQWRYSVTVQHFLVRYRSVWFGTNTLHYTVTGLVMNHNIVNLTRYSPCRCPCIFRFSLHQLHWNTVCITVE